MTRQIAGWVSSLHLLRMMAEREHMTVVCSQVCIIFRHLDESLKRLVIDYEGGSVESSSAASYKDNGWLNQPTTSGDGGNEWGVLVKFLLYGYFLVMVMSIIEFNVMGFDVCNGLWVWRFSRRKMYFKGGMSTYMGQRCICKGGASVGQYCHWPFHLV